MQKQAATAAVMARLCSSQTAPRSDAWDHIFGLDFGRPLPALVLAIIYIVSRLPWLGLGYGADPDAWRVAMSARYLLTHASYLPSRLPGYPVHDILTAALLWGGWWLTNAASMMVSLAGVFLFSRIARGLAPSVAGLLTLTFAFLPMVWSVSTVTLDYTWALTFLLGSYLFALSRRPVLAGILLGVAGGCRLSSLAFALPFLLVLWREQRVSPLGSPSHSWPSSSPARFAAATALTWLAVFSPVLLRYGTHFWNFYDVRPGWGDFLRSLTEQTIGLLPLLVLVILLACSWRRLRSLPGLLRRDPQVNAWAIAVLVALIIFVRLPLQVYYLIPATPFALLLLTRLLDRKLLIIACTILLLGGFVDIYTASSGGWRSPQAVRELRPMPGLVLQDYQLRKDRLSLVRQLDHLDLPDHSVVMAGFYFPMVEELGHTQLHLTLLPGSLSEIGPLTDRALASPPDRDIVYVWLLPPWEADIFLRQGYTVYSLDSTRVERKPILKRVYNTERDQLGSP